MSDLVPAMNYSSAMYKGHPLVVHNTFPAPTKLFTLHLAQALFGVRHDIAHLPVKQTYFINVIV